ncbi:MAG: glycosyltransferase [Synergistaceae bacterium]|nr:glycosyltransferase [Synergistaceae bacterium]
MKNFLYIANRYDAHPAGGTQIARSHYKILCSIAAEGTVISLLGKDKEERPEPGKISVRAWRSRLSSAVGAVTGKRTYMAHYCAEAENDILRIVREGSYDFIWFDDCIYGSTIRKIKQFRPEIPVFVFYHIVMPGSLREVLRQNRRKIRGVLGLLKYANFIRQQKLSALHADVNVLLNERDSATFTKIYGQRNQLMFPACFADTANIEPAEKISGEFNMFFVGLGGHDPNIEGIRWFAREVMPAIRPEAKLSVVGTNMDKNLKDAPEIKDNPRITVKGRVESLDPYYNSADVVIVPIFSGAGMMTKVAEALMYGKNILATGHALNGYDGLEKCRCDTAEDFIARINSMIETGSQRYNPAMRKIYEEKYSLPAMENILREYLREKGI